MLHKRRSVKPAPFLISGEVGTGFSDTLKKPFEPSFEAQDTSPDPSKHP